MMTTLVQPTALLSAFAGVACESKRFAQSHEVNAFGQNVQLSGWRSGSCSSRKLGHKSSGSGSAASTATWQSSRSRSAGMRAQAAEVSAETKKPELVLCFGEMLIDFVPTVSGVSLAEAPAFEKKAGGAPANVAVGISRLGGKAAFLGKVGDDEFGHMLVNILKENDVETKAIRYDENARTALAFVTLRADGEREFMFYRNPSADMLLQPSELDRDLISKATVVHFGSISLIAEPCRSAHLELIKLARESGALLSYDPNLRLPLWPSAEKAKKEILSIFDQANVIKLSDDELEFLTDGNTNIDEAVRSLWHDNLKLLMLTEGSQGSRYYTKESSGQVRGAKVEVVDTTGAGDAFVAGILVKLSENPDLYKDEKKLREALLFANCCGAITTTARGAIPSLPTPEKVSTLLSTVAEAAPA